MTKKDFELMARAVKAARVLNAHTAQSLTHNSAADVIAYNLADALYVSCPRFDRARFLKACGVES